jgi:hypothetical protein
MSVVSDQPEDYRFISTEVVNLKLCIHSNLLVCRKTKRFLHLPLESTNTVPWRNKRSCEVTNRLSN